MSELSSSYPTLLDVANHTDPKGSIAEVAEILNQENEVLEYIPWVECNDGSGHETTVRTGIPDPTWRRLYQRIQPTKSTTAAVRDATGNMQAYNVIDAKLVEKNGNTPAFRISEDRAIIQGMSHSFASNFFYGNEKTQPERFTGLSPRYNSLSAGTSDNVINAGGSTNLTSIWLLGLGRDTMHAIYPEGTKAGVDMKDLGQHTSETSDGLMQVFRTHYSWDCGWSIRDWRFGVRVANIDVSALTKDASAGADLIDLLVQAVERIHNMSAERTVIAMNRRVRTFLRRQMRAAVGDSTLSFETIAGKKVMAFDEIPVVRCDALLNSETVVS